MDCKLLAGDEVFLLHRASLLPRTGPEHKYDFLHVSHPHCEFGKSEEDEKLQPDRSSVLKATLSQRGGLRFGSDRPRSRQADSPHPQLTYAYGCSGHH